MKRKTLISRFEEALNNKKSKKIQIFSEVVDFYPSKDNEKEGLAISWGLEERIADYFYNYYLSRDIEFGDGEIIKGADEYYPDLILFGLNQKTEKKLVKKHFTKYDIYIRNPKKAISDRININSPDYDIQRKADLEKIDGLFRYINLKLIDKEGNE
jgi:ABC-type transport system substrate-binding protein